MRVLWDEYETAILIDSCLRYNKGEIGRKEVVRETSQALRQMAVNRGRVIDDVYRNENGIALKFETINGLIKHINNGFRPSKMFKVMVDMMENDRNRYDEILNRAKSMTLISRQKQEAFFYWILKYVKAESASEYFLALSEYEKFARSKGYIKSSVFEIEDPDEVDCIRNRMFGSFSLQKRYKKSKFNIKKVTGYYKQFLLEKRKEQSAAEDENREKEKKALANTDEEVVLDFDKGLIFENAIPTEMKYLGYKYSHLDSWKFVYVRFMRIMRNRFPDKLNEYIGVSLLDDGRVDVTTASNIRMLSEPVAIAGIYFFDVGFSDDVIVKKIRKWIDIYGISSDEVIIKYKKNIDGKKNRSSAKNSKPLAEEKNLNDKNAMPKPDRRVDRNYTEHVERKIEKDRGRPSSAPKIYEAIQDRNTAAQYAEAENYRKVLKERFPSGYRVDSFIERNNFKRAYQSIFQKTIPESDETLSTILKNMCVRFEEKIYLPESMLREEKRKAVLLYIQSELSSGKEAVYYDVIYERFKDDFADERIYNSDMLRAYLENTCKGRYYFQDKYLSGSYGGKIDPEKEMREYLRKKGAPVSEKEIIGALPHIPKSEIEEALKKSKYILSDGKQRNEKRKYFDASIIGLTPEEKRCVETAIDELIDGKRDALVQDLLTVLKTKYPDIYERCQVLSDEGLKRVLKYYLGEKYTFRKIIGRVGEKRSITDKYAAFAKNRDSFTIDDLKAIRDEYGSTINFDKVYENSVRVSQRKFVSRKLISFDTYNIDKSIDDYCTGDYISISEISQFATFPDCGYAWNSFLLEHYVADFSERYKLLHKRYNEETCAGAIVKRAAGIYSYDEIIIRELARCGRRLTRETALDYLHERGFIATRSYRNIDELILKAKQIRQEEGM